MFSEIRPVLQRHMVKSDSGFKSPSIRQSEDMDHRRPASNHLWADSDRDLETLARNQAVKGFDSGSSDAEVNGRGNRGS